LLGNHDLSFNLTAGVLLWPLVFVMTVEQHRSCVDRLRIPDVFPCDLFAAGGFLDRRERR
jgi:hypothetical protein